MAGLQHRLGRRDRELGRRRALGGLAAGQDADRRPEQLEAALVLAGDDLLLADHDALVTTPELELPDWSWNDGELVWAGAVVWAVLVPVPSAGSRPCAICTARPPKMAPAAANDAAIMRRLSVRVESFGLRWVLRAVVMSETLAAVPQASIRGALALYKNQGPIRKRSALAEPP